MECKEKVGWLLFLILILNPRRFSRLGAPHCGPAACSPWVPATGRACKGVWQGLWSSTGRTGRSRWGPGQGMEAEDREGPDLRLRAPTRDPAGGLGFWNGICATSHALQDPRSPVLFHPKDVTRGGAAAAGVRRDATCRESKGNSRQILVHLSKSHTQNTVHPPPRPHNAFLPFSVGILAWDTAFIHGGPPSSTVGGLGSARTSRVVAVPPRVSFSEAPGRAPNSASAGNTEAAMPQPLRGPRHTLGPGCSCSMGATRRGR